MELPALFIGRFQPLHNGHMHAMEEVFAKEKSVVVVIGSAQASFTPINPFTTGERIEMVQAALTALAIPCSRFLIVPIPDVDNFSIWADHVIRYLPPFGSVYTGSETVRGLFAQTKHSVRLIAPHQRDKLSSTEVRRRMLSNEDWRALVPPFVAEIIRRVKGVERLRSISF
jgi:nicotinamide-nucleotide adenylyltransferase